MTVCGFYHTVGSEDIMKEYNNEANMDSFFRLKELDRSLKSIRDTVLGRRESFLPFVTDKEGRLDKDRVEAFLDELICGMKDYHTRYAAHKDMPDEDTISFYRDVLYCAIVAPVVSPAYALDTDYSLRDTFAELVFAVGDKAFSMKDHKSFIEAEEADRLSEYWDMDFIYDLNDAYIYLTGRTVRDSYSEEEKAYANEVYLDIVGVEFEEPDNVSDEAPIVLPPVKTGPDEDTKDVAVDDAGKAANKAADDGNNDEYAEIEIGGSKVKIKARVITPDDPEYSLYADEEDYNTDNSDSFEEDILGDDPEYYLEQMEREEQYMQMQMELSEETRKAWKDHIGNCELLPDTYMRIRSRLFNVNRKNMEEDISEMVDIFLYRHELSAIALGKAYGLIAHRVDETVNLLETEIKRARMLV